MLQERRAFPQRFLRVSLLLVATAVMIVGATYVLASGALSPATVMRDGPKYRTVTEDVMASDAIGVHFVKKGGIVLDTPNTRTWPVIQRTAQQDLLVGLAGGSLHLVKQGETYLDDAGTYVEPVAGQPDKTVKQFIATQDTVVVEKNGLAIVPKGGMLLEGTYTKARPSVYRVASEDLSARILIAQPQIIKKGQTYLDDITTYTESYYPAQGISTPIAGTPVPKR